MVILSMKASLLTIIVTVIAFFSWIVLVNYYVSRCLKNRKRGVRYSKDQGIIRKGLVAKRRIDNKTLDLALDRSKISKF